MDETQGQVETRVCRTCGEEKPLTKEHYFYEKTGGGRGYVWRLDCRPCRYEKVNRAKREKAAEMRLAVEDRDTAEVLLMPPPHPLEPLLKERGACVGLGEWWFPPLERSKMLAVYRTQREVCATCPVLEECRIVCDHVEQNREDDHYYAGMWAGETPLERSRRRSPARRDRTARRRRTGGA